MSVAQIVRDPFARTTLVRRLVKATKPKGHPIQCSNCGSAKSRLFQYGIERDDRPGEANINWHWGEFCSKGCHDMYHG